MTTRLARRSVVGVVGRSSGTTVAAAALALAAAAPLAAQDGRSHAAVLLEIPASARAAALGGAHSALGGADAIHFNVAQLADGGAKPGAAASVGRYLQSSTLLSAAGLVRLGPGRVGVGVQALNYGSEPEVECADPPLCTLGRETGRRVSAADLAATLAYALPLGRLRLGAGAELVQQHIAGISGRAVAFSAGAAGQLLSSTTVGLAVQHVGGELRSGGTAAPLPRTVRLGAAHRREVGAALDVTVTGELRAVSGVGGVTPAGGAELLWHASTPFNLVARMGGVTRTRSAAASAGRPVSVGGSLVYNAPVRADCASRAPDECRRLRSRDADQWAARLAVDYAYQTFDGLGATHRIGVRWW